MDERKTGWPLVVGITAGIVGTVVAGAVLYSMQAHKESRDKLMDAQDIIAKCNEKIKEIEAGLQELKHA